VIKVTKTKFTNAAIIIGLLLLLVLPATAAQITVTKIIPNVDYNNGTKNFDLEGTNFTFPLTIYLENGTIIPTTGYAIESPGQIQCTFNLAGLSARRYNVTVVSSPDPSNNFTLTNGFEIVNPPPVLSVISPNSGLNNGVKTIAFTGTGVLTGATANITNGTHIVNGIPTLTPFTYTFDFTGLSAEIWSAYVKNTDGNQSNTLPFTLNNVPPTISDLNPVQSFNNAGSTAITINGGGFRSDSTAYLNKTGQPNLINSSFSVTVPNQIIPIINLTNAAVGQWNVIVQNSDGQVANDTNAFAILYPFAPTVGSISPLTGVNNGTITITILGTNFQNGASAFLNLTGPDIQNTTLVVNTPSNITATFQLNGAPIGVWNVIVMNNDGQKGTLPTAFTIKYPAPAVESITPSSGTNTGIINITDLHGDWFRTGATVKLSRAGQTDIPGTSVIVDSQTRILCLFDLTGKLAGPWNVTVTNTDTQSGTKEGGFIVTQPDPTVSTITPETGVNNGVKSVNITGTGFKPGVIARLTLGSNIITNQTPLSVSTDGKLITCSFDLTGAPIGLWDVNVTNLFGSPGVKATAFTITNPVPVITGITPNVGINNDDLGITNLSGSNFQSGANVTFSKEGQVPRYAYSVNTIGTTRITCVIGLNGAAVGFWNVTVRNPDTLTSDPLAREFYVFYPDKPDSLAITPEAAINTAPVTTIITGSGFHANLQANLTKGSHVVQGNVSSQSGTSFQSIFNITGAETGLWDLIVTNDDEQHTTKYGAFNVTAPVPPASITNLHNTTYQQTWITWSWTDPSSVDFDHVMVYLDGMFKANVLKGNQTYNASGLTPATDYTISTQTVGTTGLINQTPVNLTRSTAPLPPVPPASITNLHNTTYQQNSITWNWTDPSSSDFDHVMVYLGGLFQTNVTKGIQTFTAPNLTPATDYTIATQTVGTTGLINQTPVNSTKSTAPIPPFPPVASFTAIPDHGFVSDTVFNFTDTSMTDIISRNWNFGDGYSSILPNPQHTYTGVQNYTVTLTVTNLSSTNTTTKTITVTNKPVAAFTATPTDGNMPLLVNFEDLSTYATAWYWQFGDGTNSTNETPSHIYITPGIYRPNLTVSNAGGSGVPYELPGYITVAPVASFTATPPTTGDVPLKVQFNDTSMGAPTAWAWDFGDYSPSSTSNEQNPSHIYVTPGVWTVRLEVTKAGVSNISVRQDLINATQPKPVAGFTGGPPNGTKGVTEFHFIDQSTNNPTSWLWSFGDGTYNTSRNTTHIYQSSGNKYISLTASNAGGSDTAYGGGPIVVRNPQAVPNFTGTPTLGSIPLKVQFTDTSSNSPTTWVWDFGDGFYSRGNPNPVHYYNEAGTYNVTLQVNDTSIGIPALNPFKRTAYITAVKTPIAAFTANQTSGPIPLVVRFTDQSQGNPYRYSWNFGDRYGSTEKNPTHIYQRTGNYTVTETVRNPAGFNTTVKQNLIIVTKLPEASFTVNATSGIEPTTIRFTDTSTGVPNPNSWSWNFGDGAPWFNTTDQSKKNPVHTYLSSGVYSVQLIISNGIGSSSVTKPSLITIGTQTKAQFEFSPMEGDVPLMIQFTDTSYGNPISYAWNFGDGRTSVSNEKNPIHTYTRPDNYTVTLTIKTSNRGTDTTSQVLVLTGKPVASFKANPISGSSPLTVQFTDTSMNNPTFYSWTFGDGEGSFGNDVANPVHTYSSPGPFNAKLFVSNSYGSDTSPTTQITVSQFP
jgi:PKD repeat protein